MPFIHYVKLRREDYNLFIAVIKGQWHRSGENSGNARGGSRKSFGARVGVWGGV